MTIENALKLAGERGLLSLSSDPSHRREYDNCLELAATPGYGWDILAGWLSALMPGLTVWASHGGVTGLSGTTVYLRVVALSDWENSTRARLIAEEVTGETFPTSQGAIARKLWERCGPSQWADPCQLDIIKAPGGFYVKSIPGVYKTVWQYDLSNAYGSIIARLPSPYIKAFGDGGLLFKRKKLDMKAWVELQECSKRSKYLGRALYGTAIGSSSRQRRWHKGDKMMHRLAPGPFRPLGHLAARIVYELSYLASQSDNVVHSYTDCVTLQDGENGVPVWDAAGAEYKLKSSGSGDIINSVCYRVGEELTEVYKAVHGLPTIKPGYVPSESERGIKLVRGDSPVPQLFSSFLIVNGGS